MHHQPDHKAGSLVPLAGMCLCLVTMVGCTDPIDRFNVSVNDVPNFQMGMSIDRVQELLAPVAPMKYQIEHDVRSSPSKGERLEAELTPATRHQFTVEHGGREITCIGAHLFIHNGNDMKYYFLFSNEGLEKIMPA